MVCQRLLRKDSKIPPMHVFVYTRSRLIENQCDHGAAFQGALGCHNQPDCAAKSAPTYNGQPWENTFCGYGVYPRSCWVVSLFSFWSL
jgi:hypothetical protein